MKKVAVITGGSSGLGFALARLLGKEDYFIAIIARNIPKIDKAVKELSAEGISAKGFPADVTNEGQLQAAAKQIQEEFGRVDCLIINAGRGLVKVLSEYSDIKEMKYELDLNLWGAILTAYFFEPLLQPGSKALFISSGFGLMGAAGYSMYCAAKAGMINFAEAWRREVINKGISVYVAAPGDIDTPLYREELASQPEWMRERETPRKVKSADEVARKILKQCRKKGKFLIIPASDAKMLYIATKLLPRRLRDAILDKSFTKPAED